MQVTRATKNFWTWVHYCNIRGERALFTDDDFYGVLYLMGKKCLLPWLVEWWVE